MNKPHIMTEEEFNKEFSSTTKLMYQIYKYGFLDCSTKQQEINIKIKEEELDAQNNKLNRLYK